MEHDMKLEKITFCPDGDEAVEFFVLDSQRLAGVNYLLVTDSEVGDGEALILKDVSADEAIMEKKFAKLYSMLSKAHLGRK